MVLTEEEKKRLKRLSTKYDKLCTRLELWNAVAYDLENEIDALAKKVFE